MASPDFALQSRGRAVAMLRGLVAKIDVPYFACFRKPASTSAVLTYPVPPPSTIFGLILNALGVENKHDTGSYFEWMGRLQRLLLINVSPEGRPERPVRELAKLLKMVEREDERERRPGTFPSSPMFKEFLVRPSYLAFLASEDGALLSEVATALREPKRPLYIGQSDDMAVVEVVWEGEVRRERRKEVWGLLRGLQGGCEALKLPFGFEDENTVLYLPLLSLPPKVPFSLPEPGEAFIFGRWAVELFGLEDVGREARR